MVVMMLMQPPWIQCPKRYLQAVMMTMIMLTAVREGVGLSVLGHPVFCARSGFKGRVCGEVEWLCSAMQAPVPLIPVGRE